MRGGVRVTAACLPLLLAAVPPARAQQGPATREVVVDVRVHGNHTTPDADVLQLAAIRVGDVVTGGLVDAAATRLRESGRFREVEIRKRYASIEDPGQVLLVILVEEHAAVSLDVPYPGPLRRIAASTMWQPLLTYEDGYGFTYGARVGFVRALGPNGRLSVPLTWGGTRQAVAEAEWAFRSGPVTRVLVTGGITRREHPALDLGDRRAGVTARAERAFGSSFRAGAAVSLHEVAFGGLDDRFVTAGADVVLDTRTDPAFARNAVFASVGWKRLWFDTSADTSRVETDLRGYLGLPGQAVLVVRGLQQWSPDAVPAYEQPLLGGAGSLRGYRLGYRSGDRLMAGSAEVRMPISSPLSLGRTGIAVFWDIGTVYAASETLDSARADTSAGAGFFVQATVFSLRVDVARRAGGGTRAHVTVGTTF